MSSERLIEKKNFSYAAVLAEHKIIGCKQRWTYSNFWGQLKNANFAGTNWDVVERLLKQPTALQRKVPKYCYVQPT